ncbi:hypothetical protein JHK82_028503 [Glycine max]|uniref:Uncharacterized protein n=2 Tax=Glycine subgen. Soja TaxID=1462606 RepID=A0A0R0I2W6_SOYBN|nr:hypothetical protein JHK87_028411 [Glycine soja]KAG4997732.1 hypothetical protein JHK85_029171 [Glycine max]KAG5004488.1 hypothetical protein JHK86_028627 [Glycine max]KAG5127668.1 hypothetical protein JHK82_028503 [Glycine max]KAG5152280.1 hypothetical protein JHK84_028752 [Glycine max]
MYYCILSLLFLSFLLQLRVCMSLKQIQMYQVYGTSYIYSEVTKLVHSINVS